MIVPRYWHWTMLMIWVGLLFPALVWSQVTSKIDQANHLYNQSQFNEAIAIYEELIASGRHNGHMHYNLGNAYFRMKNLPKAILHYIKAQKLLPRNEDVQANLEYALRQTEDQLGPQKPQGLAGVFFWVQDFNLKEHMKGLLWINLIFWISMAVNLRTKVPAVRSTRSLLLAFLVLTSISTGFRWHQETRHFTGVILTQETDVHSGWSADTPVLFQLHQGAVVSISREKGSWYEIELPDAEKGWLLKSYVTK